VPKLIFAIQGSRPLDRLAVGDNIPVGNWTSEDPTAIPIVHSKRQTPASHKMDNIQSGKQNMEQSKGAGGTTGGIPMFFIGLALAIAGGYMLTSKVTVTSGVWALWGYNSFGLSLLPFLIGTGLLFFNGRSLLGWLLTLAGVIIILSGILMNMSIYFQPTSLFDTLMMLGMLAAGVGLVLRSLRSIG